MQTYAMTCSCGHRMTVEAGSRDEAVSKMRGMMTAEAISAHMTEKHTAGEPTLTVAQVHAGIAQTLQLV